MTQSGDCVSTIVDQLALVSVGILNHPTTTVFSFITTFSATLAAKFAVATKTVSTPMFSITS